LDFFFPHTQKWAIDIVSAYLNSDMKETVYMRQPESFAVPGQEEKVCRMLKSLYSIVGFLGYLL
jgi:hypothetical protein